MTLGHRWLRWTVLQRVRPVLGVGLWCADTEAFTQRPRRAGPETDTWQRGAFLVGSALGIMRGERDFDLD